jgi:hypothetical protein
VRIDNYCAFSEEQRQGITERLERGMRGWRIPDGAGQEQGAPVDARQGEATRALREKLRNDPALEAMLVDKKRNGPSSDGCTGAAER